MQGQEPPETLFCAASCLCRPMSKDVKSSLGYSSAKLKHGGPGDHVFPVWLMDCLEASAFPVPTHTSHMPEQWKTSGLSSGRKRMLFRLTTAFLTTSCQRMSRILRGHHWSSPVCQFTAHQLHECPAFSHIIDNIRIRCTYNPYTLYGRRSVQVMMCDLHK